MKTACIIGGGLGGLMTGSLLTKEGYRVTVLEKNSNLGGGLQGFMRKGHLFDPCMHVFGGMQPGGNLRAILQHLGILDKIHLKPYHDTLICGDERLTLPFGRDAWIDAIGGGKHKEELKEYIDALYCLADSEDLFNMRPSNGAPHEMENISAEELIERHISDLNLRKRLTFILHLYDGRPDSPALLHALTSVLHIDGIYSFESSAQTMAQALADIITTGGGCVLTGSPVSAIEADGRRITAVLCGDERHTADYYISAISIGALLNIAPKGAFSPAFRNRIAAAEQCCSAFCIYAILKPQTMKQNNASYHILRRGADPWEMTTTQPDQWPHNMFLMTRSDRGDNQYADTMTIVAPMMFEYVKQWEESTLGHRPAEYRQWKERMTTQAMQMAQEALGPIETEYIEAASPLSVRDYNGTTQGTCYGLHSSVGNLAFTTLSTRTRMENLFLSGQDVNFHGMVGTSLTAVLTAETIVGRNVIVDQINHEKKQTI